MKNQLYYLRWIKKHPDSRSWEQPKRKSRKRMKSHGDKKNATRWSRTRDLLGRALLWRQIVPEINPTLPTLEALCIIKLAI